MDHNNHYRRHSIHRDQCAKKKFGRTCPSDRMKETLTCPNHNVTCPKNFMFTVHVGVMDSRLTKTD